MKQFFVILFTILFFQESGCALISRHLARITALDTESSSALKASPIGKKTVLSQNADYVAEIRKQASNFLVKIDPNALAQADTTAFPGLNWSSLVPQMKITAPYITDCLQHVRDSAHKSVPYSTVSSEDAVSGYLEHFEKKFGLNWEDSVTVPPSIRAKMPTNADVSTVSKLLTYRLLNPSNDDSSYGALHQKILQDGFFATKIFSMQEITANLLHDLANSYGTPQELGYLALVVLYGICADVWQGYPSASGLIFI